MSDLVAEGAARLKRWREDPAQACRELWDVELDKWQRRAANAFADPEKSRIAIRSCKGPGKTAIMAMLGWVYLVTHLHAKGVAVAITGGNLRQNLWPEFAKWRTRSQVLRTEFYQTATQIVHRDHRRTWWLQAREWSRSADPEQQADSLAGLHGKNVLVLMDEMGGIPLSVLSAAEGILTGVGHGFKKIFGGGNPTHLDGALYHACVTAAQFWHTITVTGDPDDPERSARVSLDWAREQIETWGPESAWVLVNVFARFPESGSDALFALAWFEDAFNRWETGMTPTGEPIPKTPLMFGLDIARFGSDSCVLTKRRGGYVDEQVRWGGQDTVTSARRVIDEKKAYEDEHGEEVQAIATDDTGVGGGVTDYLAQKGEPVIAVDNGSASLEARYLNRRAYDAFQLRLKWMKPGFIALAPSLRRSTLVKEGSTLKYGYSAGNKIKVEKKDDFRKRNKGQSPDNLDSLILSFTSGAVVDLDSMGWV